VSLSSANGCIHGYCVVIDFSSVQIVVDYFHCVSGNDYAEGG